jgi:fatty acid-binding protein DegV
MEASMTHQKIIVVTDSSAYIPAEAQRGLDITVIPLWLIWDDDRYRDGIDIEPQAFYARLKDSKSLPTSSQPSAKEFELFFRQVAKDCDAIVAVLASSRISGTVECAQAALADFPDFPIRIVDSLSSSMGLGFAVLAAARAARAGKTLDEVVKAAESMRDKIHEDGLITLQSQARTKRKALNQMLEIVDARLGGKRMAEAAIVDIDNPEEGQAIGDLVRERFSPAEIFRAQVSPVVGTHVGPGTVGIAFYAEE